MKYVLLFIATVFSVMLANTANPGIDLGNQFWQIILSLYIFVVICLVIEIIVKRIEIIVKRLNK